MQEIIKRRCHPCVASCFDGLGMTPFSALISKERRQKASGSAADAGSEDSPSQVGGRGA
jgi:hypothetical protein